MFTELQNQANQPQTPSIYLSDLQIANRYGVTRQSVWRWANSGSDFPKPIKLTAGCTRWRLSDVERWESGKAGK
jgi:prophage regulatory protein